MKIRKLRWGQRRSKYLSIAFQNKFLKLLFFVWKSVVVRGQPPNPRGFLGMTRVFDICL